MSNFLIGIICPDFENQAEKVEQTIVLLESFIGKDFFQFYIDEGVPIRIDKNKRIEIIRKCLLKKKLPLLCNGIEDTLSVISGRALITPYGTIREFFISIN